MNSKDEWEFAKLRRIPFNKLTKEQGDRLIELSRKANSEVRD